jgi:hypothetical protein
VLTTIWKKPVASIGILAVFGALGPASIVAESAAAAPGINPTQLGRYVVPPTSGFVSQKTSLSGGPTGKISFEESTSSDCAVGTSSKAEWMASELRYYKDSPRFRDTYELLCVSEFRTTSGAVKSEAPFKQALDGRLKQFSAIPSAEYVQIGPATELIYSKGPFSVFVVSADLATGNATHLCELLGLSEYRRLPN